MDEKVKVHEIAEEAGATSADVINKALDLGLNLKSAQSAVSDDIAEEITNYIMTGKSKLLKKLEPKPKQVIQKVQPIVEDTVIVNQDEKPKKREILKKPIGLRKVTKVIPKEEVIKKEETPIVIPVPKKEEVIPKEKETPVIVKPTIIKPNSLVARSENGERVILKKRGLTIVKKSRPIINHPNHSGENYKKQSMKSMSELFGKSLNLKETYTPKQKRISKKTPAKSHGYGKVLNVHSDSNFKASDDSLVGEEIMLHDMNLMETSKFLQEPPRKKTTNQNNKPNRPSAFGNRPRGLKRGGRKKRYVKPLEVENITEVTIPEQCRVYEFAEKIGKTAGDVIGKLFMLGMMVTKNDFLGNDEIEILGEEYEIEITIKDELEEVNYEEVYESEEIDTTHFITRAPIVTIM